MSVTRVREGGAGKGCLLLCDGPRVYTANMSTLKILKKKKAFTSLNNSSA